MISPVIHWLDRAVAGFPDRAALFMGGGEFSYGDLHTHAVRMAAALMAAGVRPGEVVSAIGLQAQGIAVLAHALPRLGCPFLPLDARLPSERLAGLLSDCGVRWAVCGDDTQQQKGVGVIRDTDLRDVSEGGDAHFRPLDEGDIHLIIATSGSTGDPKGVMLSGANIAASTFASRHRIDIGKADRWLVCMPLFHVGGLSILYRMAEAGACALIHDGFDPEAVARAIADEGVTHVSLVPAMLAQLLDLTGDAPPPPGLRVTLVGGAAFPEAMAHRAVAAGWPIYATYGMSETSSQLATRGPLSTTWTHGDVGAPLSGFEISLQDENSGVGRLRVRGPAVMAGYANPQLTRGTGLDDGWYLTSDIVRLDGETLVVVGRADDVLVSGGENVHPAQIEAVMAHCPGVDSVCVVGQSDPVWGQAPVAVVTGSWNAEKVLLWARENLSGPYRPRAVHIVTAIPLLGAGKPDRRAVLEEIGKSKVFEHAPSESAR
ncbi:MAG: acyl--CoA ligase [Rhodospirillales bacterium]|nr:acyl--CoA ligase [Rhodospirillales bacterium]MCW8952835.1 acyl--CoA ligase [Rhodospirillales bacterium]